MRRKDISLSDVYQRYIGWYKEFHKGSDVELMAQEDGYSPQTVKYGIRRVSELLLIDKGLIAMYGVEETDRKTLLINDLKIQVKKHHITPLNYRTLQKTVKELIELL